MKKHLVSRLTRQKQIYATKEYIKELLGVPEIKENEKYLGLPAVVGKNNKESLNYIKERI